MKRFFVLVALLALVVPAALGATHAGKGKPADNEKNAAKSCKAERASLGVDPFNKKYGTNHNLKNGFGKCVSGKSKKKTEGDQQETLNAAKQCKKERADMGVGAFANKYGTNHNKANAFGKCVSSKAKAQGKDDAEDEDVESAEDADEADDD